jgi:hypothetical protein
MRQQESQSHYVQCTPTQYSALSRLFATSSSGGSGLATKDHGSMYFVKAGLPMILFCGLGVWVVANGLEGKNKERDAFQGRISK